jgi:PAS domain S-box-containing protein
MIGPNGAPSRSVTELERIEAELRDYAERMAEAERIAQFGVWKWEPATDRVQWSDQLHRIYGLRAGEFEGTTDAFQSFLHPDDRDRVVENVQRVIETGGSFVFEERIVRPDGEERMLLSQGSTVRGNDGSVVALVGVCHDVTDRARAERALGLSERRMHAIINNTPSIVAVKDLDGHYLMTNAETGRILGVSPDELIGEECARVFPADVAAQLRANDRKAAAEGEAVYDETILRVDGERRTYVTVTFALPDERGLPAETCTIATDVTERRERESERRERLEWRERIESALAEGRMIAFAQPVVDASTGEHESRELLARIRPPNGDPGMLLPGAFLPPAERYGLIQRIDAWMVEQAVSLAPELPAQVNLSAVTLCDTDARRKIIDNLEAAADAAPRIVFEITESAAADHIDAACDFAEELADLGCGLALDDFGVGFGSFTYLRKLPLRYLKIDRSFVRDVVRSRDDRRVVRSIIDIADQFDLRTIAEGVEDEETLSLLTDLGAHYVQGYHVGRPAPLPDRRAESGALMAR